MLTYGFYNSINGDRTYNAEQISAMFDGIINDGIFMTVGEAMAIAPHAGMTVKMGTGRAWFHRTWTDNDSLLPIVIDQAEVVLDRIDAVVLEIDTALDKRVNGVKVIKGTPSSLPARPAMSNTETRHQYPLAYISVPALTSSITAGLITNMRGTTECPWVNGVLETVNTEMLEQIEAYLAKIIEVTSETKSIVRTSGKVTSIIARWEDGLTKKEEEIITRVNGKITSVETRMYDQAGSLGKIYIDTITRDSSGRIVSTNRTVI